MRPSQAKIILVCGSIALGLTAFQNCGQVAFVDSTGTMNQSASIPEDGDPTEPPSIPPTPVPPATVVCDPFNQANIIDPKMGIEGSIYSTGDRLNTSMCADPSGCTSRDYVAKGMKADAVLFLSQIFVPTRNFTAGFSADGKSALQDANNQDLVEWFALDLHSQLVLDPSDAEGDYQIAIISDDGHSLDIQGSPFMSDEGEHSPRLACSSTTIQMTHANAYPFQLTYFQGPRTQIALVMMWRKVDASTKLNDCGTSDGNITNKSKLPNSLASRGWKVLQPSNFQLEAGKNLCAPN